ncbi:hypothetical protein [Pacificibacter marinus]|uniref:Uncharacterized protein n=4 Tax=Pacificibacter marinus TaxID=658057 RepID=A0A1Y5TQC1_9RHOB|nr:hypothetical protein [Pacificibacter marinus]SLN65709.1 hypothetical protein PAM7971_03463 [Pacificibacter marinus]
MSLSGPDLERMVMARPFASVSNKDIYAQWVRVATLNEAKIGATMRASIRYGGRGTAKETDDASDPKNKVGAHTVAGRALRYLAQTGSGRTCDATPLRDGINDKFWRSSFPYLRQRGLATNAGQQAKGVPHVWTPTEAGWDVIESYGEDV